MKNTRAVVMLALSIVIGIIAAFTAAGWMSQQGALASNKVVVAAVDIELGSRLNPQMLMVVEWPYASTPAGAFGDIKNLEDRVVKTNVLRGEAVLDAKLAPVGTKGGLSAVIAEGKRAMTVRVNDVVGVAGFALPGNYVDVVVNTQQDKPSSDGKQISKIVLDHILVLAVAQEANRDETKPKVVNAVTLELTPTEAEKLDLARSVGTLSLVLRNQVDGHPADTAGITKQQLLVASQDHAAEPVKEPAKTGPKRISRKHNAATPNAERNCVEIIKGNTRNVDCF